MLWVSKEKHLLVIIKSRRITTKCPIFLRSLFKFPYSNAFCQNSNSTKSTSADENSKHPSPGFSNFWTDYGSRLLLWRSEFYSVFHFYSCLFGCFCFLNSYCCVYALEDLCIMSRKSMRDNDDDILCIEWKTSVYLSNVGNIFAADVAIALRHSAVPIALFLVRFFASACRMFLSSLLRSRPVLQLAWCTFDEMYRHRVAVTSRCILKTGLLQQLWMVQLLL